MKQIAKHWVWLSLPLVLILYMSLDAWSQKSTKINPTDNMAENIDNLIKVDDAAFTPATSSVLPIAIQADDTSPDSINEGDAGAVRGSLRREMYVQVRDAAGNERGLNVDASGRIASTVASLPVGTAAMAASTPVTIASDDTLITALKTALEIMDDWDNTNRANVSLPTTDVASVLYDGAGDDGVNGDNLELYTTSATLIAGSSGMTKIDCDASNALDIFLANEVASQACTLVVSEFSAATPTVATLIRQTEISIPTTDQTATVDRVIFNLTTATEYPCKAPVRVTVTPGAYVLLSLATYTLDANEWYCRYQLHGNNN